MCPPGSILRSERTGREERLRGALREGGCRHLGVCGRAEGRRGKADTGGCSEGPTYKSLCWREGLGEERWGK